MAIGAAFCFLVMMLNVPIPDGTTAHAVGGVLVAVLLGPEAAVIAVSVALAIQALFFGDGGILAFGANCFNMAFVLPVVGYGVYRLLSRRRSLTDPRRAVAAGIGGYVGINAAALCAAIELGLQPVLFTTGDGTPLYAPFHLSQTIPAMMLAHLLVAGVVELVLTAGVVAYLQRANLPVLRINHDNVPDLDADLVPGRGPARVAVGRDRDGRAGGADPARPARPRRRVRRGRSRAPRPAPVRAAGHPRRPEPVQRLLEPCPAERLRVRCRPEPHRRLPRVGRGRHRRHRPRRARGVGGRLTTSICLEWRTRPRAGGRQRDRRRRDEAGGTGLADPVGDRAVPLRLHRHDGGGATWWPRRSTARPASPARRSTRTTWRRGRACCSDSIRGPSCSGCWRCSWSPR